MGPFMLFLAIEPTEILALIVAKGKSGLEYVRALHVSESEYGDKETGWAGAIRTAAGGVRNQSRLPCVLLLPRYLYSVTHVELPPGTDDETQSMLELELAELVPLPVSDIAYGWEELAPNGGDSRRIEVYWTPARKISSVIKEAQAENLDVVAAVPSAIVYRHLFQSSGLDKEVLENQKEQPVAFLDISDATFEFLAYDEKGELAYSRGVRFCPADDVTSTPPDKAVATEVARTLEHFSNHVEDTASFRWFLGRNNCRVPDAISGHAPLNQASQALQCLGVDASSLPVQEDELTAFAPLVAATQLATRDGLDRFHGNMVPGHIVRNRKRNRLRKLSLHIAILVLGVFILAIVNLWLYERSMESQLRQNREEIKRLTPVVAEVEAMEQRVASIRDQIDYMIPPLEALTELNRLLQTNRQALKGLYLDHLTYAADGKIRLEGHATNDILPWRFAEAISGSGRFLISEKPVIVPRPYGDTRTIRFQIGLQALRKPSPKDNGKKPAP